MLYDGNDSWRFLDNLNLPVRALAMQHYNIADIGKILGHIMERGERGTLAHHQIRRALGMKLGFPNLMRSAFRTS